MCSVEVWTWGTGGAYGREFGLTKPQRDARRRRGQSAASLIVGDRNIVIDAGPQCAETMIDNDAPVPEIVFLTHEHADHCGGLDQLAKSRTRSMILKSGDTNTAPPRLIVIGTEACLTRPPRGVSLGTSHMNEIVRWVIIPEMNTWFAIDPTSEDLTPSDQAPRTPDQPFVEFKAMDLFHTEHAPGACMYVFRITDPDGRVKRVIFSGDFCSIDAEVLADRDIQKADLAVLETNTIRVPGIGHSTLERNIKILQQWYDNSDSATIVLTHIGGYEDCARGPYDHVPDDSDWLRELDEARARGEIPESLNVQIAHDGGSYPV